MPNFSLEEYDLVQGKQKFFILSKDNYSQFNDFCQTIEQEEHRYLSELRTIVAYMEMVSNLHTLPKTKLRNLTPDKEQIKEYELKTKHLRVYFIHIEKTGKIILTGGYKKDQTKDIDQFRSFKKQYLDYLKTTK